jgi:hypothetical protein
MKAPSCFPLRTRTAKSSLLILSAAIAGFTLPAAEAAIIGTETFSYADGSINDQSGGTGWNLSGGMSDWDGSALVANGELVTNNNVGAFRQFGGDEFASAVQAVGQLFFRFTLTFDPASLSPYAGLSSFDFGTEKVFFGRVFNGNLGIDESGVGQTTTAIAPQLGATYTLVGVIDFENDRLALFVNPDAGDTYDPANGGTADAIRGGYTSTNWSSQIRVQSGDTATSQVRWDNITVATTAAEVGIPEPGTAGLLLAGLGALAARRRRRAA